MLNEKRSEKDVWKKVKSLLGNKQTNLGQHWSYNLHNDPKRLAFVLSRYKFVAKMASKNKSILELGCSEGIGVPIVSEFAREYTGVDMDHDAIVTAKLNWTDKRIRFIKDDFIGKLYGAFDTVISLDVIEHIMPEKEKDFFHTIYNNTDHNGIAVIGTPNVTSSEYASPASKAGHVNMFDAERLRCRMQGLFYNVFIFSVNDEMVHTGFLPMAHYLICLGCYKRTKVLL